MFSRFRSLAPMTLLCAVVLTAACGGEQQPGSDAPPVTSAPAAGGAVQPGPGGRVITVEMLTDDAGNNVFKPSDITAKPGDVLRFTLVSGVHNLNVLPDSNAAASGLPAASQMLQAPGQTHDVLLSWNEGRYYFQCDPHALLGMVGHVTIGAGN